jgi:acetyltransferase-like isoleucine patch superfamily enzyme
MSTFFKHPQALVESTAIGDGTRIWAFAHVLPGATIGKECNICDHVFIENDVVLGDRVTIKCGVQLWDGLRVEDDVFIGPNATFTNDPMPRSKQHLTEYPETRVRRGASIGANATILPGIVIGQHAIVGAGSVVTNSVPPHAIVQGNPARIMRYVGSSTSFRAVTGVGAPQSEIKVKNVQLLKAPPINDLRGNLYAREVGAGLPFVPRRYFVVIDVPSKEVRSQYALRNCEQLLICLKGSVCVACDDGSNRQEFFLDSPELGLHLPSMIWSLQYKYSSDAILLVLASVPYDPDSYIRDYDQFLAAVAETA